VIGSFSQYGQTASSRTLTDTFESVGVKQVSTYSASNVKPSVPCNVTVGAQAGDGGSFGDFTEVMVLLKALKEMLQSMLGNKKDTSAHTPKILVPSVPVESLVSPLGVSVNKENKTGPLGGINHKFLSDKPAGEKPADIFNGLFSPSAQEMWLPGMDEHDDFIAAIRMVMAKFGQSPKGVFDEVSPVAGGYNITMKDDFKLHITQAELDVAATTASFFGNDTGMIQDAKFIFAVMNKRKQIEAGWAAAQIKEHTEGLSKEEGGYLHYSPVLQGLSYGATLATAGEGIGGLDALNLLGMGELLDHKWSHELGGQMGLPAVKAWGHHRGVIQDGVMHTFQRKDPAPMWMEVFTFKDPVDKTLPVKPPVELEVSDKKVLPDTGETTVEKSSETRRRDGNFPEISSKRNGERPADVHMGLYTGRPFMQQREIATFADSIKLIMLKYGQSPTDIFSTLKPSGDGYEVKFRDGFELKLSREEISLATQYADFEGKDKGMIDDANFLYAAYIKRQSLDPKGAAFGKGFEAALLISSNGRTVKNVLEGMGMAHSMRLVMVGATDEPVVLDTGNSAGLFIKGVVSREGKFVPVDGVAQSYGYRLV
jgi:hypothetical protein